MKLRILSEADIRDLLSMREAIEVQREAFRLLTSGASVAGLRSFAVSETPPGIAIFNPSFLKGGRGYGVKVVSDFYENEKKGVPRMTGLVVLCDGETGRPTTILEGGYLTDLRTGAASGLAADFLARRDARTLAIIGAGRVARNQLEALSEVRKIEKVWLSSRTEARARGFIEEMGKRGGRIPKDIQWVESREEAVRGADIVVTATTSHTPVFEGRHLRAGTMVIAAGAYLASYREVDTETIRRAGKVVVDSLADCLQNAGDIVVPIKEGVLQRERVAELGQLVLGERPGREREDEITYFKSVGVPIQDLVTAQEIERRAVREGRGTLVEVGGD